MNLNKRFFLITTMAVLILAAIAFGPAHRRIVRAHSKSAVVVLTCNDHLSYGVTASSSSDPSVTLPADGTPCAVALQDIVSQDFSILPAVAPEDPYPDDGGAIWTLVRPSQWAQ